MSKYKSFKVDVSGPFTVAINCKKSLEQNIAAGKYDFVNGNIAAHNFPFQSDDKVEAAVMFVHFSRCVSSGYVKKIMDKLGFVPIEIEHLLGLGAQHPDLQKLFTIVCLGSSFRLPSRRLCCVPCLGSWPSGGRRKLDLDWCNNRWSNFHRFAAIRR
jgi:hypothetical protein